VSQWIAPNVHSDRQQLTMVRRGRRLNRYKMQHLQLKILVDKQRRRCKIRCLMTLERRWSRCDVELFKTCTSERDGRNATVIRCNSVADGTRTRSIHDLKVTARRRQMHCNDCRRSRGHAKSVRLPLPVNSLPVR